MPTGISEAESFTTTVNGPAGGDPRTAASVRNMGSPLASRTRWLRARLADFLGGYKLLSLVDPTTDVLTSPGHGLVLNDPVRFTTVGGTLPGGLVAGVIYYARDISGDTFKVAASAGGSAIDLLSAGSGDMYAWSVPDAAAHLYAPAMTLSGLALPAGTLRGHFQALVGGLNSLVATLLGNNNAWTGTNTFSDLVMAGTTRVKLTPRQVTRAAQLAPLVNAAASVQTNGIVTQTAVSSVGAATWELDLPHGSTLKTVSIILQPAAGHGSLPGTMPVLGVYYRPTNGLGASTLVTTTDTSASVGAYEAQHSITTAVLNHLVDRTTRTYFASLSMEANPNAIVGLTATTPSFVTEVSEYPEA